MCRYQISGLHRRNDNPFRQRFYLNRFDLNIQVVRIDRPITHEAADWRMNAKQELLNRSPSMAWQQLLSSAVIPYPNSGEVIIKAHPVV